MGDIAEFPDWVRAGADVVVVSVDPPDVDRTLYRTTIARLPRTQVVLADETLPRFTLQHFKEARTPQAQMQHAFISASPTTSAYWHLFSAEDPAAARQARRIELDKIGEAYQRLRRAPSRDAALALSRAAEALADRIDLA